MRLYDRNEGEYVSFGALMKHVRDHRRPDGMAQPLLFWGSAGIGKCLAADVPVVVDDRLLPIGQLWEEYAGEAEWDGAGWWAQPTAELRVPAVDSEGAGFLRPCRVTGLYRQRVNETGRRVTLDDGSQITMTDQHRLLGLNGWTRGVQVGDRVAVPAQTPRLRPGQHVDPELTVLLAWQLAEGDEPNSKSHPGTTRITQVSRTALERVRECARSFGGRNGLDMHSMPIVPSPNGSHCLILSSLPYRRYLEERGYVWGRRSAGKRLPDFLVAADDRSRALFLREYVACEGHVHEIAGHVEIATASKEMAQQLTFMLRGFGVWGRIRLKRKRATNGRDKKRTYYSVYFGGLSLRRFRDHVGIADEAKQRTLDAVCARTCNSNVEGIPLGDLLVAARELTGLPPRWLGADSRSFRKDKGFTKPLARELLSCWKGIASGAAEAVAAQAPASDHYRGRRLATYQAIDREALTALVAQAEALVEVDAHWAKVVEVERVKLDGYVYDLEVEDCHNYLAGGMITHNSARVRSFAAELGLKTKIYLPSQDNTGSDIVGERVVEEGRTVRVLPRWLPDVDKDGPNGVLFIDEINRGPKEVRDGLLELVGDGTIMQADYSIPEGWQIVAAANPADLGHDVYDIDDAMVDRFLHVAPGYDAAVWAAWAAQQETMHQSVIDYALSHPHDVDAGEVGFPIPLQGRIKPTPRAWANLGFLVADSVDEAMLRVIALGMLGREVGDRYVAGWLEWQQGRRPLTLEALFDTEGGYDQRLASWARDPQGQPLLEASNERIIGGLLGKEPDEALATLVGRYLAVVPEDASYHFFDSALRTIPDWLPSLRREMEDWRQSFDRH